MGVRPGTQGAAIGPFTGPSVATRAAGTPELGYLSLSGLVLRRQGGVSGTDGRHEDAENAADDPIG
jgi:hypothetical protein